MIEIPNHWYTNDGQVGDLTMYLDEDYDIPLPKVPDKRFFRNEKSDTAKFEKTKVPKNLKSWTNADIERYAEWQWHRRQHGEWWWIKGQPYYFPRASSIFFDYWMMETGDTPTFRMEALELFTWWYMVIEPDDDVLGGYVVKPRRIGETEKFNFIAWEAGTRYKNSNVGLNSYTDTEASHNFDRLVQGALEMPFFFRPVWEGKSRPKEKLSFMPPAAVVTEDYLRNMFDREENEEFLGSYFTYMPTKDRAFDGWYLRFYFLDEILKIKQHQMDVKQQIANIRKCITLYNEEAVIGKMIASSTAEKTEEKIDADTLEIARDLFNTSNPKSRPILNRTPSGLLRLFRSHELSSMPDEYGFHDKQRARERRDARIQFYLSQNDIQEVINIKRKEPESIDDALAGYDEENLLHPILCEKRMEQLRNRLDWIGRPLRNPAVRGNLYWKNGFLSSVYFQPDPNGKWYVSQPPLNPNNVNMVGKIFPKNTLIYRSGCDPYDAMEIVGQGSDGAFAVKRRFSPLSERKEVEYNENGEVINPWEMDTDQYVCDYKFRHENPYDFYDDYIKTLFWYGTYGFPEADKPGFMTWAVNKGLRNFIMYEPKILLLGINRNKARQGSAARGNVIESYDEALKQYIGTRIATVNHPRLLAQWAQFKTKLRTKLDLVVATGFTELADMDKRSIDKEQKDEQGWKNKVFEER